ncbi:MAG: type II secretion system F family protein, partial [Polyangiaceae bacterium]
MAVFEYRGLVSATGKSVTGVRDADNPKALRAALKREGVLLTAANEDTKGGQGASRKMVDFGAMFRRVNVTDVAMMTRQLATLVGAGIPLVEAVSALTEQVEKQELKRVLTQVRDRLNEGISLAKALEPHQKVFAPLYVNMVAAGEASGTLEQVLERLADFMESQARLRGKVSAALAYPGLMLIIGSSLISVMMVAVVPKVTQIFSSLDRALPWYTATLIFVSAVISSAQMGGFLLMLGTMVSGRKAIQARSQGPQTKEEALAKKSVSGWVLIAIAFAAGLGLSAFFVVESIVAFGEGVFGGFVAGILLARFVAFLGTPPGRLWRDTRL